MSSTAIMNGGVLNGGGANVITNNEDIAVVVPNDLKTLIRIIMRLFYGFELYLCMEMLLVYPCLKEEDLADLLRLDLKLVYL